MNHPCIFHYGLYWVSLGLAAMSFYMLGFLHCIQRRKKK